MKLGVFAAVFGDRTFEETLESAQSFGFEAIELGAGNFAGTKDCDPNVLLNDETQLKELDWLYGRLIKQLLDEDKKRKGV